jgi:predicted TIM-barrel fold metal-dependent hydrolase
MPLTGPPPIVDAHAHIFTGRMPLTDSAWARPAYDYPTEAYLADLDRHGVAFGVVAAASLYGDYNDYTLQALAEHKRLRATVIVRPDIGRDALARLAAQGVVGVRWVWRRLPEAPDLRAPVYRVFLNRLADLGMHVELLARGEVMSELLPALDETGVRVVLDHFGDPGGEQGVSGPGFAAVLRALQNGRTWVKVSAGYRLAPGMARAAMDRLLAEVGPERLVWGSDAPFVGHEAGVSYAGTLETFEALAPDPLIRRQISDTALRLYFF